MLGRMMDFPLTLTHLFERAERLFPGRPIVSRKADRSLARATVKDFGVRTRRLMSALEGLGVQPGTRVATLAWNHAQHLEVYFAVPLMGAIVHTLNLRLHPNEIAYIADHAEDSVVVVDASLVPLLEKFIDKVPWIRHVVVIADGTTEVKGGYLDYEKLLEGAEPRAELPQLDERAAAMLCYTSGTTGNPKGVLYTHRSTCLHAMAVCLRDSLGLASMDTAMPVVPMFHAAAWGIPYAAIATGAKLVFPGPHLDPASIVELMEGEEVTLAAGVPTIWLGILDLLDRDRKAEKAHDLSRVRTMVIGGAAAPPAMIDGFKTRHGLEVTHAWGMTEMNPLGTVARLKPDMVGQAWDTELPVRATQGFPVMFVEHRLMDESGKALPWDGKTMGELEVRGPWVASSYFADEGKDRFTETGWFKTGDVVTIDPEGYVTITDRAKDVVKSGGEWISSVALENALMSHPAVLEAAVFAAAHPKWDERPVAAIVQRPGSDVSEEELAGHIKDQFASYWLPDAYVFMDQIPRTSTGKFLKTRLRELYGDILLVTSQPPPAVKAK